VILQVPPGTHVVNAQLTGYRTTTVTEVGVGADRTSQASFALSEEAIAADAVVVTAERPPIELDVTGSQTTIDAGRVAEAPVAQLLDYLTYEPGVSVSYDNELRIRGGGPSEIRLQVDGLDRTDALTSKSYTQLNQVLVAEVTVLTGGFDAEYGNVRSGMVNVVVKDGTEGGAALPLVSGVYGTAPAQQKHFGPGAYDEDQYDYWPIGHSSPFADSGLTGPLYWPFLYDETKDDPQFNDLADSLYRDPRGSTFRVFRGWEYRAGIVSAANRFGSFGKSDWSPAEAREAWEWEANRNEQVWQYGHEADWSLDLASGWALPNKLGGIIVGYVYNKEMTAVPALRPSFEDRTIETKLTLTPTDRLKIAFGYMMGKGRSTGAGSKGTSRSNPELNTSGAGGMSSGPVPLRSSGSLVGTVSGVTTGNNKLHRSYNGPLDSKFNQFGVTLTYTFGPSTFMTASAGRTASEWDLRRDDPRTDVTDFTSDYRPPTWFGFQGWLGSAYGWTDTDGDGRGDKPTDIDDATEPGRAVFRHPFQIPNVSDVVPSVGRFVAKTFEFDSSGAATVVSPQGYM